MEGHTMAFVLVRGCKDEFVKLVDEIVDSGFEHLQTFLILVAELVGRLLYEVVHIADIVKVGRTNLCVDCHQTLVSLF